MPETPDFPDELPLADVAAVIAEATTSAPESETPESTETAHVPEATKENAPMIDIHDAHHAASSWREFFIHIATIVLGLIIAVSLEQTVEYFHHRSERRQLEEDLRAEAEGRIPDFVANIKSQVALGDWYRAVLERGRTAAVSGGFVTFVMPDPPLRPSALRPENGTWPAAEASGRVAVLPKQEVEGWDLVDYYARRSDRTMDDLTTSSHDFHAVADRLGISVAPGATVRVTPAERDELMRSLATLSERAKAFRVTVVDWQGTSDGATHGASTDAQMQPYIQRALAGMPK
jgi:hypothetical protein